ncbi:MAG: TRAP transporter small permease [Gammaproteobacteria bacterium]
MTAAVRLWIGRAGLAVMAAGGAVVVVQAAWISYGVVRRYVFRSPDAVVTEATALLLFPVAFAGLVYAMQMDAYPRVTVLVDSLSAAARRRLEIFNLFLTAAVVLFFAVAAAQAAWRDFNSGAASEILLWPRFLFWAPAALSLSLFSLYSALVAAEKIFENTARRRTDA